MTKGPHRLVLDQYLDSATEGFVKNAGQDWKDKADDLTTLGEALKLAAQQAELRIGEQTLTGPALRAGMEESSASMISKAEQLRAAGDALRQVGQQIADTRDARDSMQDLGTKPAPYQAPAGTPGVEPTPEELQARADASAARQAERTSWQSAYDKQEAKSLALTKEMDAAFLAAIPPMKQIHGEDDPTEPPSNVPSGPGGPYLPGTQAPPVTGGGNGGGNGGGRDNGTWDGDIDTWDDHGTQSPTPTTTPTTPNPTTNPTAPPTTTPVHTEHPTTTVLGSSQSGVTYQPSGAEVSAPSTSGGAGGTSAAATAAAFGAAGGAGGLAAGAVRPGVAPSSPARGAGAVKPIGSTGRAGSAGSLSRSAGSIPGARGAGAPGARGASSGSVSSGSAAGRGSAGGRAAGGARGAGTGSSGARGGVGAGGAGGRGSRTSDRDRATERDSLVYDQDWLSDDDVAPGVLD